MSKLLKHVGPSASISLSHGSLRDVGGKLAQDVTSSLYLRVHKSFRMSSKEGRHWGSAAQHCSIIFFELSGNLSKGGSCPSDKFFLRSVVVMSSSKGTEPEMT
ncbi:hypothetical protein KC19_2G144900 [Ceratodon purpureus]|uniref:Uncharacterized protein n=1 Tax=Ceratodon purpureus TaxID=3225 RepID=A0A8T0IVI6_CERPU|nr:hypothetical protein KC19_2G144900 [Ceratodon purpureus]